MGTFVTAVTVARGSYGFNLLVLALNEDGDGEDWSDATTVSFIVTDPDGAVKTWDAILTAHGDGSDNLPQFQCAISEGMLDVVGVYTGDVRVEGTGFDIRLEDLFTIPVRAIQE